MCQYAREIPKWEIHFDLWEQGHSGPISKKLGNPGNRFETVVPLLPSVRLV